jgi:hypothetical protein
MSSKGFRTGQICTKDLLPGATVCIALQIIGELRLLNTISIAAGIIEK